MLATCSAWSKEGGSLASETESKSLSWIEKNSWVRMTYTVKALHTCIAQMHVWSQQIIVGIWLYFDV